MPRHVAFLRAINIGGRRATAADLCSCLEELGFSDVATFRASGNVIFDADRAPAARLTERIDAVLTRSLGYDVVTFLRTAAEVRAIAERTPFVPKAVSASAGKLQVALLEAPPGKRVREEILSMANEQDRLAIHGRELYWLPSGGTMESDLNLRVADKLLGPNTRRTKSMIEEIAAKFLAP